MSEEREDSTRNVHCVVKGKREEIIIIVMRGRKCREPRQQHQIASEEATNCKRDEMYFGRVYIKFMYICFCIRFLSS